MTQRPLSRYATVEDVMSPDFMELNKVFDGLSARFDLPDHSDINESRYPWSAGLLNKPAFYAARLWEYPYCILSAEMRPGMKVADVGCGMTAFTVYLKHEAGCDVVGVDPDVFESGVKYKGHGVSQEFIERTGLKFVRGDMDHVPLETDSQDRVFCVSVMEHVPPDVRRRGMQEIARILKPGGRAILTVDVSMWFELNRPLDLIWESGLTLANPSDLSWPARRFGMFDSGKPADVFGMTLVKEGHMVDTEYRRGDEPVNAVAPHLVPTLIPRHDPASRPLWRRAAGRLARDARKVMGAGE